MGDNQKAPEDMELKPASRRYWPCNLGYALYRFDHINDDGNLVYSRVGLAETEAKAQEWCSRGDALEKHLATLT